jgi:hypothetical protein
MGSSHTLDQLDSCFDDTHVIANAGLLLPATLGTFLRSFTFGHVRWLERAACSRIGSQPLPTGWVSIPAPVSYALGVGSAPDLDQARQEQQTGDGECAQGGDQDSGGAHVLDRTDLLAVVGVHHVQ